MKKNVLCLGLLMTGVLACFQIEAQTITAPVGTPLTITNSVDVILPGGKMSVPIDGSFNFGTKNALSFKNYSLSIGPDAGNAASTGVNNVFLGENAGVANTIGAFNLFLGSYAGVANIDGNFNTFMGTNAGRTNASGQYNTYIGLNSGFSNTQSFNLFLGGSAGQNNVGGGNVFLGPFSGKGTTPVASTGTDNTFMGSFSGEANTSGSRNVFIGKGAGKDPNNSANDNATGSDNVFIGHQARGGASGLTNAVALGSGANVTTSNTVVLGNNATVVIGATGASAAPAKLEIGGTTAGNSGIKNASLASGSSSATARTGGYLTASTTGEIIWANGMPARLGNPDGITSAEGTATFSDNNWSLANGYLKNTSKRGVVIGEGITTMPEGYSFYVADGILTEKVKVAIKGTDEWADYVFGKNYNRMSLTDVAKYIEKNNHLPNVPSAAEMVQNGNDLHKTDVKLLEKIEELTLYMIEMKKENEQLKKDVDSLKKRRK